MPIKPITKLPPPEVNERMERLKADVREIIDKRVPYCEIVDPPYPQSTMRERLVKAVRIVIWEMKNEAGTIRCIRAKDVFKVESRKIDGLVHWYVSFDTKKWDEEWAKLEVSGDG